MEPERDESSAEIGQGTEALIGSSPGEGRARSTGPESEGSSPVAVAGGIRVGCVTWPKKAKGSVPGVEANAADAMAAIGWLASSRPDLIVLPEGFLYAGLPDRRDGGRAADSSGQVLPRFAEVARRLRTYLAVPLLERTEGGPVQNVVALFARDGSRIGTYRKRILWPSDDSFTRLENGLAPGDGGGPFETEFGLVDVRVCLEVHWPGPWRLHQVGGAKLVLFPSEHSAGMLLRHRAWQSRSFVVSAVSKGGPSQVIDPLGDVIAEWWPETPGATIDIGLNFELVHFDHNESKLEQLARDWNDELELTVYRAERLCRVTSRDPHLDLPGLLNERGIPLLDAYLGKVREANAAVRTCHASSTAALRARARVSRRRQARSVSVIIPSLGVPETLETCIDALQAQEADVAVEIVVVLNGPGALTDELRRPGVRVVRETKRGPAAARNAGVKASTGDVIAFIDADCIPERTWLGSALATLGTSGAACIVAGAITRSGARRTWVSLYDSVSYLQQERYVTRSGRCVTANMIVHREIFERVGPFNESFQEAACEDWEWAMRAGRRRVPILFEPDAVVDHPCMNGGEELKAKAERLSRGELVLRRVSGQTIPMPGLLRTVTREVLRAYRNEAVDGLDRFRVMCVATAVAFWAWHATRSGRHGSAK